LLRFVVSLPQQSPFPPSIAAARWLAFNLILSPEPASAFKLETKASYKRPPQRFTPYLEPNILLRHPLGRSGRWWSNYLDDAGK
jgi:hypothetical protein